MQPLAELDERAYETWFVRRGVPHCISGYAARTDIWTRALVILVVAYLLGGLNALDVNRSVGWNVAAAAMVLAVLTGTWMLANRLRHRPAFSVPHEIGPIELAAFLIGPVIPPLVVGQWGDAFQSFAEGVGVLAVIYVSTSYAVLPLLRWAARQARAQFFLFLNTVVRVLPLLLLVITFLFVNAEVWQMAGRLHGIRYVIVVGLFVGFGIVFVLSRVPGLIDRLSAFGSWDEVRPLLAGTPAEGSLPDDRTGSVDVAPLRRRERFNLGLVAVFSQGLQITLVAVTVFVFFLAFGYLAIPPETTQYWTTVEPHVLFGGGRSVVTEELVRVAGFLSAFTGMYFTVVLSTDATYREEFAEDVAPQIRTTVAVRAVYLAALGSRPAGDGTR